MRTFNNIMQRRALRSRANFQRNILSQQGKFTTTPSGLMIPHQHANFGGMMGMGELADILAGKCDPNDKIELWGMEDRSSLLLTMPDRPGVLNEALQIMAKNNINLTAINSVPPKTTSDEKVCNINIDFHGNLEDENVKAAMQ